MLLLTAIVSTFLAAMCSAKATVQGNCTCNEPSLLHLESVLSANATISCHGQPGQLFNAQRYWGTQYSRNASVVIFPTTSEDVSHAVRAIHKSSYSQEFAFAGGAHSMVNASSSEGAVIDLAFLNHTNILPNFVPPGNDSTPVTAVVYGGGALSSQVLDQINGTGYVAVTARASDVGMGGFSTGGGIGFLAGAYGFATDRLRAVEVVLASGEIVNATASNEHQDLFWALHGGNGQFGIVTKFYQEAATAPTTSQLGVYYVGANGVEQAQQNTVEWFENNRDPFSVFYYSVGFYPPDLTTTDPSSFTTRTVFAVVHMNDPTNSEQPSYDTTFAPLLAGVNITYSQVFTLPYANLTQLSDGFFPRGDRRQFNGPQTTRLSVPLLSNVTAAMTDYIDALVDRGEFPASTLWNAQYMYPGLNGNAPKSDKDTAWPHSVPGHQMLFSPGWLNAENDGLADNTSKVIDDYTHARQAELNETLASYPNYVSPTDTGRSLFGDNIERLIQIKEKYDPHCLFRTGKVFASRACVAGGWANLFP